MAVKPKWPCSRECPERKAGCHGQCPAYLDYETKIKKYREEMLVLRQGIPPKDTMMKNLNRQALHKRSMHSRLPHE